MADRFNGTLSDIHVAMEHAAVAAIEADRAQRAEISQDWRDDQDSVRGADRVDVSVMALKVHGEDSEEVTHATDFTLTEAQALGMFQGIGEATA